MIRRVLQFLAISACFTSATAFCAGLDQYLGRWNIYIFESGDTFPSAWLKVEKTAEGPKAWMVWKWGSVVPVDEIKVDKRELLLRRRRLTFRIRKVGGEILGVARPSSGKRRARYFVGRPAPELCDPVGTWLIADPEDPARMGKLLVVKKGKRLTGKGFDPDGRIYKVQKMELKRDQLLIRCLDPEGRAVFAKALIKGDRMDLTVKGGSFGKALRLKATRKREWGKPIRLFDGKTLQGWRPRDARRRFGWHVEDSSFTNTPPDVDIVSERKFRDFKLHLEYKVNAGSNSGCYLRGRYELQILGDPSVQPHGNMAVYSRLAPKKNPMRPMGQWQSLDVTLIGRYVTVVLNGVVVHDNAYLEGITGGALDPWEGEPGPLLLQGDHGKVWFRNVIVTPAK